MSDDSHRDKVNVLAEAREGPDPIEQNRSIPFVLGILIGAVGLWGSWYLYQHGTGMLDGQYGDHRSATGMHIVPDTRDQGGAVADAGPSAGGPVDGAAVYQRICVACHQQNGAGIAAVFPPLDGSEWVTMNGRIPASIVVHGLVGEIDVKGVVYNGAMPAFGAQLTDEEVAAVVSYVRSSWSNDAPAIDVEDVQWAREASTGPVAGGDGLRALLPDSEG